MPDPAPFTTEHREQVRYACLSILATIERHRWNISRGYFHTLCSRMGVKSETIQAILECDAGLVVQRKGAKRSASDRFVLRAMK
jgi:hypothetical protein